MEHRFGDSKTKHLIIELIMLTAAPLNLVGRTTQTLVWLSSVPPPPDHVIRPLGGGHIRHKFFKEYMAPLLSSASRPYNGTCARCVCAFIFSSIRHSLTYNLGQAYTLFSTQAQKQLYPIEISSDHLMFTQSDTPAASASTSTGRRS